jgi:subtilisin family serine protease/subtilisin-like proprotein convertase family protein
MHHRTHLRKPASARARLSRPALESLEDRMVLSTTSSLPLNQVSVVSDAYSSSDILVRFRQGDQPRAILSGTSMGPRLDLVSELYEVNLSNGVAVQQALAAYQASSDVVFAEPDYSLQSSGTIGTSSITDQQWALQAINARDAWNVTRGSNDIIVAVNDTGIDYDHPDLYRNIWINQAAIPASRMKNLVDVYHDGFISMADLNNPINQGPGKITDLNHDGRIDAGDLLQPMILDADGEDTGLGGWIKPNAADPADGLIGDLIGWNFSGNNNNPFDNNGHGTHVAGIIAGSGKDGGTLGVAPDVRLMPIEFLDASGHGTIGQFIEGLDYAVAHGARISNNSWTGADPSQALTAAIDNARAHGMILVTAAGNDSNNNDATPVYPAGFSEDNVIAVAATDKQNDLAGFSNYGVRSVDVAAPGVDILSTLNDGSYGNKSGTSMAAPVVAGVLALVWSEHPDWTYRQVIERVENSVTKVPALAGKVASGGIVNAGAAVGSVSATSTSPVSGPSGLVVSSSASGPSPGTFSTIKVTFSVGVDPSSFTTSDLGLIGPNGHVVITGVTVVPGTGDRTFKLSFATQTTPGTYTLYVGIIARDLAGSPIAAYTNTFHLVSPPAPTHVISSTGSGPTAYSLSTVRVTFNRGVNPTTFTASDVGLIGPAGHVAIHGVSVVAGSNDCTFNITFAPQSARGTYTLYVGSKAKDLDGHSITAYSAPFKVAPAPVPTHVVSSTASGPSAHSLSTIQVTFSAGISPSTFTTSSAGLIGPGGHIAITGVSAVDGSNNRTFNINFATQSAPGTYTLYLGTHPRDLDGKPIGAYTRSFNVAAAPVPTHVVGSSASGPSAHTLSTIRVTFDNGISLSTFNTSGVGLIGPAGHVAITRVSVVAGSNNRTFNITFATQSAPGTYTLYLGTQPRDLDGKPIASYQAAFKITAAPTPSATSFTSSDSVAVTARGRGVSLLKINQNLTIGHIIVKLNVQYPQVGELYIHLQSPSGTDITLCQWMGGNTANFPNTTFDDNAHQSIAFAAGPYTGSYQPLTPLSYLNGEGTQGTWKMWVENQGSSTGRIVSWNITVKPS